jgi:hypothetical protein
MDRREPDPKDVLRTLDRLSSAVERAEVNSDRLELAAWIGAVALFMALLLIALFHMPWP